MITMFGERYNEVIIRRISAKEHPSFTEDMVVSKWQTVGVDITIDYDESKHFIIIKGQRFITPHNLEHNCCDEVWIPLATIHSIMVPISMNGS